MSIVVNSLSTHSVSEWLSLTKQRREERFFAFLPPLWIMEKPGTANYKKVGHGAASESAPPSATARDWQNVFPKTYPAQPFKISSLRARIFLPYLFFPDFKTALYSK